MVHGGPQAPRRPRGPYSLAETAPAPRIQLPPEIQEFQQVTVTCLLNFSCPGYEIKLKWSLGEFLSPELDSVTSTSLTTKTVYTQSKLTFQARWYHHDKNLACQLWNDTAQGLLSQDTVRLDVKRESPQCSYGKDEGLVPFSPTLRS